MWPWAKSLSIPQVTRGKWSEMIMRLEVTGQWWSLFIFVHSFRLHSWLWRSNILHQVPLLLQWLCKLNVHEQDWIDWSIISMRWSMHYLHIKCTERKRSSSSMRQTRKNSHPLSLTHTHSHIHTHTNTPQSHDIVIITLFPPMHI